MKTIEIGHVAVLGAGTMGAGIAQVCAGAGCQVALFDVDSDALLGGMQTVEKNLRKGVEKKKLTEDDAKATQARIKATNLLEDAVAKADCVIEAVPENIELKCRIFADVSAQAPDHAILATNTSSLPVTQIAAAATDPSRVIGMHFFNPPHIMRLLEIVRAEQTDDAVVASVRAFGERIGKDPIVVIDSPGFASSRLGVLLGLEAIRMLESGVASAEDIDRAMEVGYRHPMGPLKLTDLVGLDVRLHIAEHLHEEIGEQFRPPALLRRMVRAGKLGKKTKQGFYTWD